ncbi:uncharacterized protein LOC142768601 isoform X1 [Rhipicephalus microplus]|uniref:uncharacterized protein LOC142768601 isoform X1 n=1 Tax=Rhipicephalus microplus TaxID=6941 RepID=UPI003F6D97C0
MVVFGQNSVVLLGSFAFFYTPWLTPTYVLAGITPSRPTPNARPAGTPQIKRRNPSVNMTAVFIDAFRSSYVFALLDSQRRQKRKMETGNYLGKRDKEVGGYKVAAESAGAGWLAEHGRGLFHAVFRLLLLLMMTLMAVLMMIIICTGTKPLLITV